MRRPALMVMLTLAVALASIGFVTSKAAAERIPLTFWTVAKSDTWDGTPSEVNRFMATVGLSELSSGLQSSGFKGTADLNWIEGPVRPKVRRTVTLTALKARIISVDRQDSDAIVTVSLEPTGYELVAVDVSGFRQGELVTFVFQDSAGTRLAAEKVLIE